MSRVYKKYSGFTDSVRKYQKSEKYKVYRRKYESYYRDHHRLEVNFSSWKVTQRKYGKRVTVQKEMNYLLKRMLNE